MKTLETYKLKTMTYDDLKLFIEQANSFIADVERGKESSKWVQVQFKSDMIRCEQITKLKPYSKEWYNKVFVLAYHKKLNDGDFKSADDLYRCYGGGYWQDDEKMTVYENPKINPDDYYYGYYITYYEFLENKVNYLEGLKKIGLVFNEKQTDTKKSTIGQKEFSALEEELFNDDYIDPFRVCLIPKHKGGLKKLASIIKKDYNTEPDSIILGRIQRKKDVPYSSRAIRDALQAVQETY